MNSPTTAVLEKSLMYIRNLANCPPSYLNDPGRKDFFEIVWLKDEYPLHQVEDGQNIKGDWIYLIPPYRVHQLNKAGKNGELISFKRDVLDEGDKEFFLDLFKMFNVQGEFSCLKLDPNSSSALQGIYSLMAQEYQSQSITMVKAFLKVFLLKLIQVKEH